MFAVPISLSTVGVVLAQASSNEDVRDRRGVESIHEPGPIATGWQVIGIEQSCEAFASAALIILEVVKPTHEPKIQRTTASIVSGLSKL